MKMIAKYITINVLVYAVPIELVKASGEVFKMAIKSIKTSRAKKKMNNAES